MRVNTDPTDTKGVSHNVFRVGWKTPHEFGSRPFAFSRRLRAVRGRGPAAMLQARKCRRTVAPREVPTLDAASNQIGCCLSPAPCNVPWSLPIVQGEANAPAASPYL